MLPPINFKILRDAVASDRVAVSLRWEDPAEDYPVSEYVIRFVGYVFSPLYQCVILRNHEKMNHILYTRTQ